MRRRLWSNARRSLHDLVGGGLRCLGVAVVEIKRSVELGLAGEQFLQARCVLEWPVGLGLIVAQRFFQPFDTVPFIVGRLVERTKRVFDALHGAGMYGGYEDFPKPEEFRQRT